MNRNTTSLIALALLAVFTCARAASADSFEDPTSGVRVLMPEGFMGSLMHEKHTDVLLESKDIEAAISVYTGSFKKADVERAMRDLPLEGVLAGGETMTQLWVFDDRVVGLAALQGDRMAVLVAREKGLALGSFVGRTPTDAHVKVVDAVAQSIQIRFVDTLRFDLPVGFEEGETVPGAEVTYYDRSSKRIISVTDDRTDVRKPYVQQVVDALDAGLLGNSGEEVTVLQDTARSPARGFLQVDFTMKSTKGEPMASGVITRVALPGRPMWIVALGFGNDASAQQDVANFVAASMAKKTVVASR